MILRDVPVTPTDRVTVDAGAMDVAVMDAGVTDAGSAQFDVDLNRAYPTGPLGGGVGNVVGRFTLPDCAGQPYDFGGVEFQRTRATLFAVFTGTCTTCAADARALQALHAQYAPRGVRTVAVMLEGSAPMEQPTASFCQQWRTASGATHPILLDVSRSLDYLSPTRAYPVILVIDAFGTVRGRYVAQGSWATSARALLDGLTP